MTTLLLCAGLGTRLRPATDLLPKPAIPFWGLPLCYYSLYLLRQTSSRKIVANLHHLPEKMRQLLQNRELSDFHFSFSLEKEKPMGSGGALYYAKNELKKSNSFFVVNADEVMIPTDDHVLQHLQSHFEKTGALVTLLVTDHPELQKTLKPVWINTQGVIRGFGEKPQSDELLRPVHYTGYKVFSNDIFSFIKEGETHIFHDAVMPAIRAGALANTLHVPCDWWETGSFAGLLAATKDITQMVHRFPKKHYMLRVYESFRRDFSFKTFCDSQQSIALHSSAHVDSGQCSGVVFVDRNVQVANSVQLQDCLIDHDLKISRDQKNLLCLNTGG